MNWDAIGAIGEAVGAGAVVASLLYLSIQLRDSVRASTVHAKLESTRLITDFLDSLILSPELDDLMMRGRDDFKSLTAEESHRFSNMCLKAFYYFSAGYFQSKKGVLADDDWFELQSILRFWVSGTGVRAWWEDIGCRRFGPNFTGFVESEITRIHAT